METLNFELVSPVKKLIDRKVPLVTLPGSEGDFGVLPGHAPLIATLRAGVIEVYEGEQVAERIFVAGGFAEVTAERCTVLAAEAVPVTELSRDGMDAAIKDVEAKMAVASSEDEVKALGEQLAAHHARLAAV